MKGFLAAVAIAALLGGCAGGGGSAWQRADGAPESEAVREQRARDLADCAARVGAPTRGGQSAMSVSRSQIEDCMYSRGWRRGSAPAS